MTPNEKYILQITKRRSYWPYIIIGLLAAHVGGMAIAMAITLHDRTFLVVPDYYDKAQHWDASQAEQRASASLGWTVRVQPAAAVDKDGNRPMTFVLTDAGGQAIPGVALGMQYFHHAHPDQQHRADLTASVADQRIFSGALPLSYVGVWEFHFTAKSGDKTFVQTQTQYLDDQGQFAAAK